MILNLLVSSCPLILCSIGALYSEYAGVLALFMEGLISFSAFLVFFFSYLTGNSYIGLVIACVICIIVIFLFALLIEKLKGEKFIAAISLNLLLSSSISLLSFLAFGTRGVLSASIYNFQIANFKIFSLISSFVLTIFGFWFLKYTKLGLYIRITGSDSEVLLAKGVNPMWCRVAAWSFATLFGAFAGGLLVFRLNSFVPNISSGRGWMALAAVFLGNKKSKRILFAVVIFCLADIFASNVQNLIPVLPSSVTISLPYLIVLLLIAVYK